MACACFDLEITETDLEPARRQSPRVSSSQVIDVTLMVVVGMLACQDDEVDAAIATPQVQSAGCVRSVCVGVVLSMPQPLERPNVSTPYSGVEAEKGLERL